jgi:hypothetical protein
MMLFVVCWSVDRSVMLIVRLAHGLDRSTDQDHVQDEYLHGDA